MTRDIIELNDFIVLIEYSEAEETIVDKCRFDEEVIGFAFYGSGDVELSIDRKGELCHFNNTKGFAMSFYADEQVDFVHTISPDRPLQSIVIVSTLKNLQKLPEQERSVFNEYLQHLTNPQATYVNGPNFFMGHEMQNAVEKIFSTSYLGPMRLMFLRSQVTELLAHFFAIISSTEKQQNEIKKHEREKLYQAKDIITNNMGRPPSLTELSKIIGLNSHKLKKNFKELFGVPVFKYLQNERLKKAHELLTREELSIQEAAWTVGYESISSFSTAFLNKFGFRPSEVKK